MIRDDGVCPGTHSPDFTTTASRRALVGGEPMILPISAVFPTNRQVPPKVRVFVDAMKPPRAARR